MDVEYFKKVVKTILKWCAVLFFTVGASVCLDDYDSPLVAVLWLWTAIFVSRLPEKLLELFNLKISERLYNRVMWFFVAASFVALFLIF